MDHGKLSSDDCAGEEPTPSPPAFGEVLSRASPDDIIIWLKPIGEPSVDAFWRKYPFPPQVYVALPSLGS